MKRFIALDSSPLGLLFQGSAVKAANECRTWLEARFADGVEVIVPEIVYCELRRELLRLQRYKSIAAMIDFSHSVPGRYLPITTAAMDLAAELWAKARQHGKPTAHPHALDVDVILAAQVLSASLDPADFVVATSNVSHLSQFVPSAPWKTI